MYVCTELWCNRLYTFLCPSWPIRSAPFCFLSGQHWDKDVCLNFGDRCLSFLKDNVDEGPRYSMKFVEPFDEVTLEVMGAQQVIDPVSGIAVGLG